jgi:hypothetical protein
MKDNFESKRFHEEIKKGSILFPDPMTEVASEERIVMFVANLAL